MFRYSVFARLDKRDHILDTLLIETKIFYSDIFSVMPNARRRPHLKYHKVAFRVSVVNCRKT